MQILQVTYIIQEHFKFLKLSSLLQIPISSIVSIHPPFQRSIFI